MNEELIYTAIFDAVRNEDTIMNLEKRISEGDNYYLTVIAEFGKLNDLMTDHELRGFILGMRAALLLTKRE